MHKRRVFLIRNVAPNNYGGGETYQLLLARLLTDNGFDPYIVTASYGLIDASKKRSINIIESPYTERQNWSGWRNVLFPVYFAKIVKLRKWYRGIFEKYRPVVINIQSRDDWIAATPIAKKMGIKVLWTDHIDMRSWVLTNVNVWYKNLIGKWVLRSARKADKIIMISDCEKKYFDAVTKCKHLKNVTVINNGVSDEYRKYRDDEKNFREEAFCYIGRIVDYKGIGELIKAFEIVARRYPEARLNIYGDGDLKEYRKTSRHCSTIKFYGRTDEPLKVLAKNEIFVLPSHREGLSLSLLDAAMMKKKIITTSVGGNPEVVADGKSGLLVPPKNVEKLAEAMIWMLEHKEEASEMAKNARLKYERRFDFDKIFKEKMLSLYNNIEGR